MTINVLFSHLNICTINSRSRIIVYVSRRDLQLFNDDCGLHTPKRTNQDIGGSGELLMQYLG